MAQNFKVYLWVSGVAESENGPDCYCRMSWLGGRRATFPSLKLGRRAQFLENKNQVVVESVVTLQMFYDQVSFHNVNAIVEKIIKDLQNKCSKSWPSDQLANYQMTDHMDHMANAKNYDSNLLDQVQQLMKKI